MIFLLGTLLAGVGLALFVYALLEMSARQADDDDWEEIDLDAFGAAEVGVNDGL